MLSTYWVSSMTLSRTPPLKNHTADVFLLGMDLSHEISTKINSLLVQPPGKGIAPGQTRPLGPQQSYNPWSPLNQLPWQGAMLGRSCFLGHCLACLPMFSWPPSPDRDSAAQTETIRGPTLVPQQLPPTVQGAGWESPGPGQKFWLPRQAQTRAREKVHIPGAFRQLSKLVQLSNSLSSLFVFLSPLWATYSSPWHPTHLQIQNFLAYVAPITIALGSHTV